MLFRSTFALTLRDGEGAYVFEYQPQGCRFVAVASTDPVADYLAVFECWASDMLALLRAEVASTTLMFGRSRHWNANPARFAFAPGMALLEYAHPLRLGEPFLALYRRILAALPDEEPAIRRREP